MRRFVMISGRLRRLAMAATLCLAALVAACSGDDEEPYVERPVAEIYNEGVDALEVGEYDQAADRFDEVERQHPYSPWAVRAQLMAAYAYYQSNEYEDAVAALDRFIQLHPAHSDVAYAYYLKGLSHYEQISDVARDQRKTEDARRAFEELITRYPDSAYSRDAKLKLDLTNDHLAGKQMVIGRYYLNQRHYLAAINRFQIVIDRYGTTTHVLEALLRLVEAYTALGITDEAQKMAAVLGHNFPGSEWYVDAYALVETGGPRPGEEPWYKVW